MGKIRELGYDVTSITKHDIGTRNTLVDLGGQSVFLHNTTSSKMYYGLNADDTEEVMWEIEANDVHGPLFFGQIYLKAKNAGILKVLHIRGI